MRDHGASRDAAVRGFAITKLAPYEPPDMVDDSGAPLPDDYLPKLRALVTAGRRSDAVEDFWRVALRVPSEVIAQARTTPMWPGLEALGSNDLRRVTPWFPGPLHSGGVPRCVSSPSDAEPRGPKGR
jgi:hypothetical protein